MRNRTNVFAQWCQDDLPFQHLERELSNGYEVDIRVRTNKFGDVQCFIGVYRQDGSVVSEEYGPDVSAKGTEEAMRAAFATACSRAGLAG